MRNAVLLFIYKMPEQVNILIDQILKGTTADIYVHINKKYDSIRNLLIEDERVYVTKNNLPANWGDDGLCKAIYQLLKEVVQCGKIYNHVAICSGQDLLVRENLDGYLDEHQHDVFLDLRKANGPWDRIFHTMKIPRIFMNSFESKYHPLRMCRSLYFKLIFTRWGGGQLLRKPIRYNVSDLIFYYSYFWGSIPYEVVKWCVDYIQNNPSFMDIYDGAFTAEERFLATLIMMSPYAGWVSFDEKGKSRSLTYTGEIGNKYHPPVLTLEDTQKIEESGAFFARKFDLNKDQKIIEYFHSKICKSK